MIKYIILLLTGTNIFAQGLGTTAFMADLCRTSTTPAQVYSSIGIIPATGLPAGLSTSNYVGTHIGDGSGLTN